MATEVPCSSFNGMSPNFREDELLTRVARMLPRRGVGRNMITERLNRKIMQLENLQHRVGVLSSLRQVHAACH